MKKVFFRALGACLVLFSLVSCGGGGGGGEPPPPPAPTTGTITGTVNNAGTGAALASITVSAGTASAMTDASGNFTLTSVPAGNAVVAFNSTNFAEQSKTVTVTGGATSSVNVLMVPVALTQTFSPTAPQTLNVTGTTAQVNLPANSLRTATGTTPTGDVTARITPISPAANPNLMPGEFTVSAGGGTSQIESFGALAATFTDASGNPVTQVASGQTVTIRIPVSSRATTPPPTIPLMFFNPSTGMWVQEGTATLAGGGTYYEGTVTHFTTWNADQVYNTTNVTMCVRDSANQPVSGVRVTSDGIDYTGSGSGTTNSSGSAIVPMKRGATAAFTATSGTRVSNTVSITTSSTAATFTESTCLVLASENTGNITIKLTWGANPEDLDSHLRGPNGILVAYYSPGALAATPFASLDVDDVDSFGPEVITITRLAVGTYKYFVHNFSGTFSPGITGSPARVELRNGGQTSVFSPPSGETVSTEYWHVFNINVASNCAVTITPVDQFVVSEPTQTGTGAFCNTTVQPGKAEMDDYAAKVERARLEAPLLKP